MSSKEMTPIDETMIRFMKKINDSPEIGVRIIWTPGDSKRSNQTTMTQNPDYLSGVAFVAYQRKLIDEKEMEEIILCLYALGAKSTHFKSIMKDLTSGKL